MSLSILVNSFDKAIFDIAIVASVIDSTITTSKRTNINISFINIFVLKYLTGFSASGLLTGIMLQISINEKETNNKNHKKAITIGNSLMFLNKKIIENVAKTIKEDKNIKRLILSRLFAEKSFNCLIKKSKVCKNQENKNSHPIRETGKKQKRFDGKKSQGVNL